MALNGIDISNWQANIDLTKISFDFVIAKATQGTHYVSPSCDKQIQQAKTLGKLYGVYHYAEGTDPTAEANYFLTNIQGYLHQALLVLDFEAGENNAWNNNPNTWIKTFCDHITNQTGIKPLIYIQASALAKVANVGDYGLWIAQYANNDPTGYQATPWNEGAYNCAMRQYSSNGRFTGYNGPLDVNKFYGDATAWNKYANPTGAATTSPQATTAPTVDIEQLARDVIAGKYGDGDARRNALGANYDTVQARVNQIVGTQKTYHTVSRGETLSGIAARYGTSWQKLARINSLSNPNLIHPGQTLLIQ
ncbi:LysM peptidoglycan-binding domain-containing protein [Alloscardovia theropitheci]|uniref:LysM peptidoglycan-binding domain-containing protein n=1 Tax=Alloscardovia theropitheci TaxID=2496842 RepID=A0A4R0QWT5_9BIFI|nr:GH25 family lysozyme [Alloscardovia theropitheci]TCD53781.1 LysM peptidoglycan-binding domain-containing protein [Alloscardovia theropitheci]